VLKRVFVAGPLAVVAVYAIGCVVTRADMNFIYGAVASAKLLAAVGLGLAAVRYGRGDYLFWAWAMLAAYYAFLGAGELLFTRRFDFAHLEPLQADKAWAMSIVLANVVGAVGTLMLARVWRVVGVALPDPSPAKRAAVLVGIVAAVALVGWASVPVWKMMLAGEPAGFVGIIGAAGDLVCFSVIAPLLLRALAMRGGTLAWPWGLVAASAFAWMTFDFLVDLNLPVSPAIGHSVANGLRVLACALAMGAGLAQRWAIRATVDT
jgi:hypothetical protein